MAEFAPHDFIFKVVLCGDSGVGKSNIMGRYTKDEFSESTPTTIGVEFLTKAITFDGKSLAIQIWDTAGQERFNSIAKSYYRGAVGAFIIYDITNRISFDHVDRWLHLLKQHSHPSIVLCLLGNKSDLREKRAVSFEEAEEFAKKSGLLFFEVSAKEATNVNRAFERTIVEIYNLVKEKKEDKNLKKQPTSKQFENQSNDRKIEVASVSAQREQETIKLGKDTSPEQKEDCAC